MTKSIIPATTEVYAVLKDDSGIFLARVHAWYLNTSDMLCEPLTIDMGCLTCPTDCKNFLGLHEGSPETVAKDWASREVSGHFEVRP